MVRMMHIAWMNGNGHQREGESLLANDNHECMMACALDT
jgi:hypothetical protein